MEEQTTIVVAGNITRKCATPTCRAEFTISKDEANWLRRKGLDLFKHCPDCRKKRKEQRNGK